MCLHDTTGDAQPQAHAAVVLVPAVLQPHIGFEQAGQRLIAFTTLFFRNYYVTVPEELVNGAST